MFDDLAGSCDGLLEPIGEIDIEVNVFGGFLPVAEAIRGIAGDGEEGLERKRLVVLDGLGEMLFDLKLGFDHVGNSKAIVFVSPFGPGSVNVLAILGNEFVEGWVIAQGTDAGHGIATAFVDLFYREARSEEAREPMVGVTETGNRRDYRPTLLKHSKVLANKIADCFEGGFKVATGTEFH